MLKDDRLNPYWGELEVEFIYKSNVAKEFKIYQFKLNIKKMINKQL